MVLTDTSTDFSTLANASLPNMAGTTTTTTSGSRYRTLQELQAAAPTGSTGAPPLERNTTFTTTRLSHLQDVPMKMQASQAALLQNTSTRNTTTTTTTPSSSEPSTTLPVFQTAQERSDFHLQRIVTNLISEEREETRKRLDQVLEEKQKARHEAFLAQILSEIKGNRTLGGSSQFVTGGRTLAVSNSTIAMTWPHSTPTTTTTTTGPEETNLLVSYLDVVRHWNRHWQTPLSQVIQALSSSQASSSSTEVWRLLDHLLERGSMGGLVYSCLQFQEVVQQRVRDAHGAGQDVSTTDQYSNSSAQTIASYVKLTTGANSVWATVYYCLRCGDAVAAWNVLETSGSNSSADGSAIRNVLSQWSQIQGPAAPLLWDATQNLSAVTDPSARQSVADLHERVQLTNGDADAYYVATLGLVSLQDPIVESSVIHTSEDYLFAWLWYVQSSEARRIELADALGELGPSHFPNSAWGFALPLLAAQEHSSALEHLAATQNSIPAVHVALVLHQARLLSAEDDDIVMRLVLKHAEVVQSHDAAAAVEYLVRLPDEQRRLKEIARLAVETNQLERFPLEELGSEVAVSAIKVEASKQAKGKGNYDLAARLLFEAGNYNSLLALLNERLSSEMLERSRDRKWRDQSKGFHSEFLTNAQSSPVLHTLQSKGQQDQLSTFRLLLEINEALELVESELFDKALTKMDELSVLPLTESECPAKARQYRSLDGTVKDVFPLLLEFSMRSLSSVYARLSMSGYNRGSSDAERHRLRSKAQLLLFSFGSGLHSEISRDVIDRMAEMERTMV